MVRMVDDSAAFEQFISEPITPAPGTADARAMGRGEPGLPTRFTWRDTEYTVAEVINVSKSSSREGGTGDLYLRRHWYTIRTTSGDIMTLYCERQARDRQRAKSRWFLYTLSS